MRNSILFLVVLLFSVGAKAEPAWKLDREGEGVQVYTSNAPGYSLKAFRATMRVKAPLDAVVALIADAESFPQWYSDCAENRIVKKTSSKDFINYFVNDSPFPVSDRDTFNRTLISQDPQTRVVRFDMKALPSFEPERDGRVRIPRLEGFWMMTPLSDEETEVVLEMRSDTGGSVPAFLANQQVTVGPHKTFIKMRKVLLKPRYFGAKVDYATATVTYGQ